MIVIPDIFESFMSRDPERNIHYNEIGEESLQWTIKTCGYNEREADRMRRGDFAYFAAVTVPDSNKQGLRIVADWLNWVFVFDDQLDDGPLGVLEDEARHYIDCTLAMLEESTVDRNAVQPIQWVLRDIWNRVQLDSRCTLGAKQRWLEHMKEYLRALRSSIGFLPSANLEDTIDGYFEYRFHSIGVLVLFTWVEYACALDLPNEVFEDKALKKLERIGVEIQMLANDSVSYHREKDQDCPHNIIHLFRHHGLSEQAAYDRAQVMLRERYREWYLALADLPIWGEAIDKQVHRYIKGIQDVASANAHWSFRTERYFGKDRGEIRRTRMLVTGQIDWLAPIMLPNTHATIQEKTSVTSCAEDAELNTGSVVRVDEVWRWWGASALILASLLASLALSDRSWLW
ncbi:isoprenoid synthase domain-containing protein [Leptodontidium sp. 2 PMI_412]|nr:isoprenoid synthase domain-containing protein [Leptodontidium sp. 2 PMI_412]